MCKNWISLTLLLDTKPRNERNQASIVVSAVWMLSRHNEKISKKKKRNRKIIVEEEI